MNREWVMENEDLHHTAKTDPAGRDRISASSS
jgi:hypothetical protein